MKLFIDDQREVPPGFTVARTYSQALILLDNMKFSFISIDYDLGEGKTHTGLDIVDYMILNNIYAPHINVHSTHENSWMMVKRLKDAHLVDILITKNSI